MDRAAQQRVVYALKNGRLVPKSEVLGGQGVVAEAAAPKAVEEDKPKRKTLSVPKQENEADLSGFEIEGE